MSFTGKSLTIPIATPTPPVITPKKLKIPDQTPATVGCKRVGVNDCGYGIGGIVKPVDKFKCQNGNHKKDQAKVLLRSLNLRGQRRSCIWIRGECKHWLQS